MRFPPHQLLSLLFLWVGAIENANISALVVENTEIAVNFERTNWATGSVAQDPFYRPPPVTNSTPPGTVLAVEEFTDTTVYTLPPGLSLSRILYVTETLNGTAIPASAYVLWPFQPKAFRSEYSSLNVSGVPVVGFAHGTSGVFGECAPSHIRNLWYQYSAPYTLALQGYAVVAPDYAGLGVNRTSEGEDILHAYLNNPAAANDVFYAVEAAQNAFPELSKQFVTMGHSQGGGASWGAAQRQHSRPVTNYLGTVAGSPVTNAAELIAINPANVAIVGLLSRGLQSIYKTFTDKEWLTEAGVALNSLAKEIQGCNSADYQLYSDPTQWLRPDFAESWYLGAYVNLTSVGRQPISGPMLVFQGTQDQAVNHTVTSRVVQDTCSLYPESQIEYAIVEGATHVPALYAVQQLWLDWIEDRFMGVKVEAGCRSRNISSLRPVANYQPELSYYLQYALEPYVVA
ncbi:alpha/beta-hydrolase [Aaosphaeria arxii CBS 175.79]|uniref:Alpha/beta-hydrolase n=1 Tax=Aaosphaeria arxii CBS 175.79 TaxID=1450172 RepID=A0A6A5XFH5_9PLEO|nr:alpha/beta-hydrolase [Aaosphaeria arxii CBS 175.79]KAF2011577.1 alpha/beta-hydrolase [Aaosphaeria arxii CBS 175.79]